MSAIGSGVPVGLFGLVSSTIEGLTSAMASITLSTFSVKSGQTYKGEPLEVAESGSNFLLFGGHFDDREAIFDELLRRGVLIRVVGPDGWLRMCMGTDKEMEQFRNALTEALRIVESR